MRLRQDPQVFSITAPGSFLFLFSLFLGRMSHFHGRQIIRFTPPPLSVYEISILWLLSDVTDGRAAPEVCLAAQPSKACRSFFPPMLSKLACRYWPSSAAAAASQWRRADSSIYTQSCAQRQERTVMWVRQHKLAA